MDPCSRGLGILRNAVILEAYKKYTRIINECSYETKKKGLSFCQAF